MRYKTRKNSKRRDLRFRIGKDDLLPLVKAVAIIVLLGRLFYDSNLAVALLMPLVIVFLKKDRKKRAADRVKKAGLQFKDAILSVAATQRAGYSAENAFAEAVRDMALLHGKDSEIVAELERIVRGLHNNRTLEELLGAFAARTGHPDIIEFAEIFKVAKRNGGNMTTVIAETADVIAQKLETERQIDVIISAKRLEARLMEAVPLFIILYVGMTNRGFFTPLYHNLFGIAVMSVALAVYLGAYLMTERIIAIEV